MLVDRGEKQNKTKTVQGKNSDVAKLEKRVKVCVWGQNSAAMAGWVNNTNNKKSDWLVSPIKKEILQSYI